MLYQSNYEIILGTQLKAPLSHKSYVTSIITCRSYTCWAPGLREVWKTNRKATKPKAMCVLFLLVFTSLNRALGYTFSRPGCSKIQLFTVVIKRQRELNKVQLSCALIHSQKPSPSFDGDSATGILTFCGQSIHATMP